LFQITLYRKCIGPNSHTVYELQYIFNFNTFYLTQTLSSMGIGNCHHMKFQEGTETG